MAIAAQKGMKIWQVNFVSAYLNSDCQYDVYMELPPGFAPQGEDDEDGIMPQVERSEREQGDDKEHVLVEGGESGDNEEHILLLLKTVYGMLKGAYDWFYLLDDTFATLKYYQSKADLYVRSRLINGEYTLTSTHTDTSLKCQPQKMAPLRPRQSSTVASKSRTWKPHPSFLV